MTVPNDFYQANYTGDGTTTAFPTVFAFQSSDDVYVSVSGAAQVLGLHYLVAGAGTGVAGTVTFTAPPASLAPIIIRRNVARTQLTSFRTQGSFSPALHELALDKLTMMIQEVRDGTLADAAALLASVQSDLAADPNASSLNGRFVQATGSNTPRTLAARFSDIASVKDFGALGDGATNDSAAFTAALAAHTTVWVPDGTFILTALPDMSRVLGYGTLSVSAVLTSCKPSSGASTNTVARRDSSGNLVAVNFTSNSDVVAVYKARQPAATPDSVTTIVNFDTLETDTHSAVTTGAAWKFTCPAGQGGKYAVSSAVALAIPGAAIVGQSTLMIYKNGTVHRTLYRHYLAVGVAEAIGGASVVTLAAGDYLDIRILVSSGVGTPQAFYDPGASHFEEHWVTIHRLRG